MNLADVARTLVRRWYITLPMLLLTIAGVIGTYAAVPPTYERTATLVLLPDASSIPEEGNPYLFLSGLNNVADVLTRAAGSASYLDAVDEEYPGTEVEIARDATTASPVLTVTVASADDATAREVLDETVVHVDRTLSDLQAAEGLSAERRITVAPLTVDDVGTIAQRTRILAAGVVGVLGLVLCLVLPTAVEGLARHRRRRGPEDAASALVEEDEADEAGPRRGRTGLLAAAEPVPSVPAATAADLPEPEPVAEPESDAEEAAPPAKAPRPKPRAKPKPRVSARP